MFLGLIEKLTLKKDKKRGEEMEEGVEDTGGAGGKKRPNTACFFGIFNERFQELFLKQAFHSSPILFSVARVRGGCMKNG